MRADRLPRWLMALGGVLSSVVLVEIVLMATTPSPDLVVSVAWLLTSLPFIAVLLVGGYWLERGDVNTVRYPRIAAWTAVGFVFFTALFVLVSIFMVYDLKARIAVLRWAMAVGAGSGALVGIFEARAIDRAVAAEQTRARNAELRRQNERLEDFANIIAHDLRNPLNVATGRVDSVRKNCEDEQLESAATALERMRQIVEETLKLARGGRVVEEPEPITLRELAEAAWEQVETGDASLSIDGAVTVSGDPSRCQQVMENFFRNAVEHSSTSPRSSSARGDAVEYPGANVTVGVGPLADGFYVEDDGPGIPEDKREQVLEPGYSENPDGTGFGLAIVNQIVEAHGWSLAVTESASGGARFEITDVDVTSIGAVSAAEAGVVAP